MRCCAAPAGNGGGREGLGTPLIVDLPETTTNDVNKKITGLREEGGAITLSRVLTLVISLDSDDVLEDSIEAANFASREHPC